MGLFLPGGGRGESSYGLRTSDFSSASPAQCVGTSFGCAFDVLPKLGKVEADYLVHCRLGHLGARGIRELLRAGTTGLSWHN
jgi:hypothetical protein